MNRIESSFGTVRAAACGTAQRRQKRRRRGILPRVKKRILLLAGGQSGEHEVSLMSARSVLAALPRDQFDVTPVVISKQGRWLPPTDTVRALETGVSVPGGDLVLHRAASAEGYDAVFPLLHGPMGEDGTIQGLLTLAGIPFVGSGVLGSAVSMDKVMTKQVLASAGIPQVAWRLAVRREWGQAPDTVRARAAELGYPLFVKPANLGSSVGISKVRGPDELGAALTLAFSLDRRVILEAMTAHKPREVEVGILGNDAPIASPVGELSLTADFYDYTTKYTRVRRPCIFLRRCPPRSRGACASWGWRPSGRWTAPGWRAWTSSMSRRPASCCSTR